VETLRGLEEFSPGAAKLWMDLAAEEIRNRHKHESRLTYTFQLSNILGQIFGFIGSLAVAGVGTYCIHLGHPKAGATIMVGSMASVVVAFITRRNSGSKGKI
jgi:uncharacterized membrane protein